jgi:microcystin-dependent protein
MANYEATRYDFDGANLTGIEGIPTATIVPWSSASVPSGFLECNGAAVSRTTYATLFGIVGTTYGAGDGSSTFNVPDLQDNVPVGKSNNKSLASTGGANTVTSTGNVGGSTANATLSTSQLAAHPHPIANLPNTGPVSGAGIITSINTPNGRSPNASPATWYGGPQGSGSGHSHNMSATFSGDATSVLQPYLTIIYVIKT